MLTFRSILVAADLSASSKEAFHLACSLASEKKTRVFVVHVIGEMPIVEQAIAFGEVGLPVPIGDGARPHHEAVEQRLRELYVPGRAIDVEYRVRDGDAADEILHAARDLGCDLIVLGTHGREGVDRLLAGSVAETVMRKARCPVLVLRSSNRHPAGGTGRSTEKLMAS